MKYLLLRILFLVQLFSNFFVFALPPVVKVSPRLFKKEFAQHKKIQQALLSDDVRVLERLSLLPNAYFQGKPLLVQAARLGKLHIVQWLVARGALVDMQDRHGFSALGWAARSGHANVAQFLLDKGAQVDLRNYRWGLTPLMSAAMGGHVKTVRVLLDHGAYVNAQDYIRQRTPLSWAVRMTVGSVKKKASQIPTTIALELIRLLLQHGADETIKDYQNKIPLQWAIKNKQYEVAKLLRLVAVVPSSCHYVPAF